MSPNAAIRGHMRLQSSSTYCALWPYMGIFGHTWPNVPTYGHIWTDMTRYGHMLLYVAICCSLAGARTGNLKDN